MASSVGVFITSAAWIAPNKVVQGTVRASASSTPKQHALWWGVRHPCEQNKIVDLSGCVKHAQRR